MYWYEYRYNLFFIRFVYIVWSCQVVFIFRFFLCCPVCVQLALFLVSFLFCSSFFPLPAPSDYVAGYSVLCLVMLIFYFFQSACLVITNWGSFFEQQKARIKKGWHSSFNLQGTKLRVWHLCVFLFTAVSLCPTRDGQNTISWLLSKRQMYNLY